MLILLCTENREKVKGDGQEKEHKIGQHQRQQKNQAAVNDQVS